MSLSPATSIRWPGIFFTAVRRWWVGLDPSTRKCSNWRYFYQNNFYFIIIILIIILKKPWALFKFPSWVMLRYVKPNGKVLYYCALFLLDFSSSNSETCSCLSGKPYPNCEFVMIFIFIFIILYSYFFWWNSKFCSRTCKWMFCPWSQPIMKSWWYWCLRICWMGWKYGTKLLFFTYGSTIHISENSLFVSLPGSSSKIRRKLKSASRKASHSKNILN